MKVTIKDIASKTGLSANSVSRALKGKPDISQATRELVARTAEELGYIPNLAASSLRSGSTKTIGVILGNVSNPFYSIMLREIEDCITKHGYSIVIFSNGFKDTVSENVIYTALSRKVDGLITFIDMDDKVIDMVKKYRTPVVLIGCRPRRNDFCDFVTSDDVTGGYLATNYLIAKGHRDILIVTAPSDIECAHERFQGYMKALRENAIPVREELFCPYSFPVDSCRLPLNEKLRNKTRFTALFAFNDVLAWEAIDVLKAKGIRVPEDIAVVGYDFIQSNLVIPSRLTTVDTNKAGMAAASVKMLLHRMNEGREGNYQDEIIDVKMVPGESA